MKIRQQGSTLIVVLILLLVVTVIGTLAIRNSLTTLNIATNSQAQQLMLQNSDSAIFHVEDPDLVEWYNMAENLFGKATSDVNKGKELVFCYRGAESSFYAATRTSLMQWVSGTAPMANEIGLNGYCKLSNDTSWFTSGRKAVMTQVAVKANINGNQLVGIDRAFDHMQKATDVEAVKAKKAEKILVTATSIVPSMSSASDDDINACFNSHMNHVVIPSSVTTPDAGKDKSVAQCLQDLGVPVNTQVVEYNLTQDF